MDELEKIHKIDLNILKAVIELFGKHNLKYYMIGGTLLGSIRHKGFIPWDDDVDIALPRKSYDMFVNFVSSELPDYLELHTFRNKADYKYYISRVVDKRYKVQEIRNSNHEKSIDYVSIDIFPIDGVPNSKIVRKFYYLYVMILRALVSLIQKDNIDKHRRRNILEKLIILIGTHLPIDKIINDKKIQEKIDKILKKESKSKKEYSGTIMGAYRTREIVPTKYWGSGKLYQFEDIKLVGPEMYEDYLHHMYGDYMKMPSKNEIDGKRHYKLLSNSDMEV